LYKTLISRLEDHHLQTLFQLIRYVFSGAFVTMVHLTIYWTAAQPFRIAPLIANIIAQFVSTTLGYNIHSRWTFRGHGRRDNLARTGGRFLAVTAFGFALNSFWVWLFTGLLHGAVWWPMPAMAVLTPLLVFWLNRLWVFS
jgi:putative flippase GtrA